MAGAGVVAGAHSSDSPPNHKARQRDDMRNKD